MTTEQQEAAAPKRYGSGTITRPVRRPHPCNQPSPEEIAKKYNTGTIWTCDCGTSFSLQYYQKDGWYWQRVQMETQMAATPYGTEPK